RVNLIGILSRRLILHYLGDSNPIDNAIIESQSTESTQSVLTSLSKTNQSNTTKNGVAGLIDNESLISSGEGLLISLIPSIKSKIANFPVLYILSGLLDQELENITLSSQLYMAEGGNIKTQSQSTGQELYTLGTGKTSFGEQGSSSADTSGDDIDEQKDGKQQQVMKERKKMQGLLSVEFHILLTIAIYGILSEIATGGKWKSYLLKDSINEHLRDSNSNLLSQGNNLSSNQKLTFNEDFSQLNKEIIGQSGIKIKDIHSGTIDKLKIFQSPALARLRFAILADYTIEVLNISLFISDTNERVVNISTLPSEIGLMGDVS
ncbi:MAG: hypothetical protein EZS28_051661, partial [Streblomastix strix]